MTRPADVSAESPHEAHGATGALPGFSIEPGGELRPEIGWLVPAKRIDDDVAVLATVVAPALSVDGPYRRRFDRRMRGLAGLDHPAAPDIVSWGDAPAGLHAAVRRPSGQTLAHRLGESSVSRKQALGWLERIAGLLDALRIERLALGDLSPRQIWVSGSGDAISTALGLSDIGVLERELAALPADTLAYAAPEQLRGSRPGPRTDVYALAVILFEALTGELPYPPAGSGEPPPSRAEVLRKREARPSGPAWDRLPAAVARVLRAALSPDAVSRPSSALALVEAVRAAFEAPDDPAEPDGEGSGHASSSVAPPPPASVPPAPQPEYDRPPESSPPSPATPSAPSGVPAAPPPLVVSPRPRSEPPPRMSAAIADQVPEAPTQSPAPRRRRGGMFLTALLAATLAAGAGSVLAAQVDEPAPPPAPPPAAGEVGSDAVALRHPADWGPVRAPGIPGLELSDTVAIAPEGAPGTVLVAGRTGPTQAGLLPVELFERLVEPPRAEAVTLGDHEAYRYGDLLLRGESRQVSLYAVPTRDGVVAITCAAPIPAETAMAACEAIATTLELPSGKSVPLGPDTAYARRLDRVLGRLADGREAQLRGLASADTVTGQRIRARELSAVFDRATRAVAALGPGRGLARLHPRLVDALRDVRGAYSALAEAAGDRDRPGYNEARRLVVARERSLSEALGEFERLGYSPAR